MSKEYLLPDEKVQIFKSNGFVVLRDFLDEASLENWRRQVWNALGSGIESPDTWPRDVSGMDDFKYDPPESTFAAHPKLMAITRQLGGGDFIIGDGIPIVRWPEPEQTWHMPTTGHIDAYGGRWLPFMFGATAYLYDVEPGGGAFVFWPESHFAAQRYFRAHPEQVDGSFLQEDGFSWDVFCDNPETGGVEFTAKAGDVVLWHSYLTHSHSANINASPRVALFARYDHRRRHDPEFRYEVSDDLWKYWTI